MDGQQNAGSLFGFLESPWAGVGGAALGAGADLWSFFQNMQRQRAMQQVYGLLSDPAKLAAYVNTYFRGMSPAENAAVQRDLGATWSVMTGGAPGGAMNQFVADALAKIESQRYQAAANQALAALSGAGQYGGALGGFPMGNLQGILRSLQMLRQLGGGSPGLAHGFPSAEGHGSGYVGSSDLLRSLDPLPILEPMAPMPAGGS